jgi:hypothetical protein
MKLTGQRRSKKHQC